jgi:hypothetical protein
MISQQYGDILTAADLKWTPELIWRAGQNWAYISNWPTLIAMPTAKRHVEGMSKGLQLLLNNQIQAIVSDPKFASKSSDLPFDLLVAMLNRYSDKAKGKDLYVIPSSVLKTCLLKFTPHCKRPVISKKK